jgi:hypothetical protein
MVHFPISGAVVQKSAAVVEPPTKTLPLESTARSRGESDWVPPKVVV